MSKTARMTQQQTIFLYGLLKKVCKKKGQYARYLEGNDDATVAEQATGHWTDKYKEHFTFNAKHVAGVRTSMFGKLHEPRKQIVKSLSNDDLTELRLLRADVKSLRERMTALEMTVALLSEDMPNSNTTLTAGGPATSKHPPGRPHSSPPA